MRYTVLVLSLICLLGLLGSPARAATHYVDCEAASEGDGSSGNPFKTIRYACGRMAGGDTLIVRDGIYRESIANRKSLIDALPSGTEGAPTTIIAEHYRQAVIQPPAPPDPGNGRGSDWSVIFRFGDKSYIVVDGLVCDDSEAVCGMVAFNYEGATHHITVQNCEVRNGNFQNVQWPVYCGSMAFGATGATLHHLTIAHNSVHDIGMKAPPGSAWRPYGIYFRADDCLIEDNDFYRISGFGIHAYNNQPHSADRNIFRNNRIHDCGYSGILFASHGDDNQLYNNLIYHNGIIPGRGQDGIEICAASGGIPAYRNQVYNNTVYGNLGAGIRISDIANDTAIRNNILWRNAKGDIVGKGVHTTQDHNLLGKAPRFVEAATGDFRLKAGSPAIDAGVKLPAVASDIVVVKRPQGKGWDLGAYEWSDRANAR